MSKDENENYWKNQKQNSNFRMKGNGLRANQQTTDLMSELAHQGCRAVEQKCIFNFKGKDN